MQNVIVKHEGTVLTIVIDTSKALGPSKSGLSTLVASTGGNVPLADGLMLGVTAYRPLPKA
jgi:hypothetical protein